MDSYKAFVRRNSHWLSLFEAVAQGTTWLLPDRSDEITLEAASALIGLVSIFNDQILAEGKQLDSASGRKPRPQLPWPVYLGVINQIENLTELSAIRALGDDNKYSAVALLEGIKVVLRGMLISHKSQGRILLQGGDVDQGKQSSNSSVSPHTSKLALAATSLNSLRTKHAITPIPTSPPVSAPLPDWVPKCLGLKNEDQLIAVAEGLFILRPLVYVTSLAAYGNKSWKPWTTSLAMDLTSIAMHRHINMRRNAAESEEMTRRRQLLVYYLLRSPCFDRFTHPPLQAVERILSPVPIVGSINSKLLELLVAIQKFYFYTAAS